MTATYHFERPDSPDPDLELAFNTLDIIELNSLPPAPPSRFPPEQEQLLGHADGVAVSKVVSFNVGA